MDEPGFIAVRDSIIDEKETEDVHSFGHQVLLRNDELPVILYDTVLKENLRRKEPRRSLMNG